MVRNMTVQRFDRREYNPNYSGVRFIYTFPESDTRCSAHLRKVDYQTIGMADSMGLLDHDPVEPSNYPYDIPCCAKCGVSII